MNLQNRLLRLVHAKDHGVLIASDVRGRVHKLDYDLNLLQSSPVGSYDKPVNALCVTEKYVFTKDRFGAIGKWDLATLQPLDFYDGKLVCDVSGLYQDEEPSPSMMEAISWSLSMRWSSRRMHASPRSWKMLAKANARDSSRDRCPRAARTMESMATIRLC